MTTAATSLLGLALPVTGELAGTWGDTVNNSITSLLDSAVAGTTTLSTDGDVTLTTTTLAANQARQAILLCSGSRTALRTITAPAQSKIYTIINATTGGFSVKLVGAGPTTGVTIVAGESAICAWNGSDFIKISNTGGSASFTNVTVSGTTTLSGLTASTALALNSSKEVVSVTNTGTGNNVLSASPTLTGTVAGASLQLSSLTATRVTYAGASGLLQDSANLTFDGTSLTLGGNPTLSGGTANGVLYLNGSKVATSGSALTFDGTNFATTGSGTLKNLLLSGGTLPGAGNPSISLRSSDNVIYHQSGSANNIVMLDSAQNTMQSIGATTQIWNISNSEAMRLTSTGLGIGTSSPGAKLAVVGSGGTFASTIYGTSTSADMGLSLYSENNSGTPSVRFLNGLNSHRIWLSGDGSGDLNFGSGWSTTTPLLKLTGSGNLGLGVTSSAWDSTYKVLEVGYGGDAFLGNTGSNQIGVVNNGYWNGGWKYKNSTYANLYLQQTGQHQWWNAASGTAGDPISFTQAMTLDASGRLMVGTTSPGSGGSAKFTVTGNSVVFNPNTDGKDTHTFTTGSVDEGTYAIKANTTTTVLLHSNGNSYLNGGNVGIGTSSPSYKLDVSLPASTSGIVARFNSPSYDELDVYVGSSKAYIGTASATPLAFQTNGTERARIDTSGNLLVGTTSDGAGLGYATRIAVDGGASEASVFKTSAGTSAYCSRMWNSATSGNNLFINFQTEAGGTDRGSISYNRAGGLVAYNVTSDYRAKDISGPVENSGALIDSVPVYMGKMKGATQERPMFIAHETPAYAHTGEKDAVDADGNPVYQQMDASALIPVMWAEIQSLRARVAALES